MAQIHIDYNQILQLEKQKRVHLINSLGGFKSVALVGTSDKNKNTNLSIFSSFFHIGANPPLIGMIFRPSPPERDTMRNILDTGFYTVNHINESIFKKAHQTSARYEKGVSEFDATGLNSEFKNDFFAPFVAESKVQLGIEFKQKIDISINNTMMIIGEIVQIYIPENCLFDDGFIDLEKANTITCSGLDSYHKTLQLDRLSYAKPDKEITSLL
ncbi:flavin reductase family protein [Flavobacterium aquatile]|uniref:Flavin oxidoreductase n=1 Tax=Flavobacterium aquatile LMG 4008 = ATCC 11947 TaxID=1453498 RepID=A0A095ST29_9FLAO|nr:flavin reductase [Flavobacterium aquatile]KGD67732.1 flavin oxidoreductase [Flavobacterium aquatile LMG 4008 = ATCC 11947]OXA67594.1 flavin oxidoreductase [Flavobacterium aquatile] [Flavobacterium aquatile LMG 4008 = ATCC 11947]GEC78226.1 flavin oxidoreductase [Flavobacterium aquatile]